MTSGKFAISVHILTLLATAEEQWLSSDYMAGSININPVLVRKELINLRKNGLIISKEGKAGGCRLARPAQTILMADIYDAVKQQDLLGKSINSPNPACPIGRKINQSLDILYKEAENAVVKSLANKTLADFTTQF